MDIADWIIAPVDSQLVAEHANWNVLARCSMKVLLVLFLQVWARAHARATSCSPLDAR